MSRSRRSWLDRLLGRSEAQLGPSEGGWSFGSRPERARREPPAAVTRRAEGAPRSPAGEEEYRRYREEGLRALRAGEVAEAIRGLGRAVHLRPDAAEAHLDLGRAAYERAQQLAPGDAQVRAARAALPPPPPTRQDFQVGQTVRSSSTGTDYRILEVRRGGFGVVYLAEVEGRRIRYALKTFQARYLWSEEDRERFTREAATWVMLDHHPNIVSPRWVEQIEGFPCLVLEYVGGGDLRSRLQEGPLRQEQAIELALQFCDGMSFAHEKLGIVHRDVKPANCLLDGNGVLKVTDLGLARAFGEAQEAGLGLREVGPEAKSQYTTPVGTPQYMAPEQFRVGAVLDTRTDIHAFGIMLWQMLTGELPVSGGIAQAHVRGGAGRHHVAESLVELVLRCVAPAPGDRPESFGAVREALAGEYQRLTGYAAPELPLPPLMGSNEWNNMYVLGTIGTPPGRATRGVIPRAAARRHP